MTYITPENKDRIIEASKGKLYEVVSQYITLTPTSKTNRSYVGQCPACKAEKGLIVTPDKEMFGCTQCRNCSGRTPVDFLYRKGLAYGDALKEVAEHLNIVLIDNIPPAKVHSENKPIKTAPAKGDFLKQFLAGSGLTAKDVEAKVYHQDKNKTSLIGRVFKSGTLTYSGDADLTVGDVLIEYYDLEGYPVKYEVNDKRKRRTVKEYMRVRYQFPEEHLDKAGRPVKYRTPAGASTAMYIPQKIRKMYNDAEKIERIFIQEGEKKAEKACRHGIPSVGISGIQNFGQKGQIPADLVKLIQKCAIKEIVLLFDSDWNEISPNLGINDDAQQRPRNFLYAARNFRNYVKQLKNRGLALDILIGHVIKNEANDKGIDDLLVNTLKDTPEKLLADINTLVNKKELDGEYLQLYNITIMGELKLQELWSLDSAQAFAKRHKEVLKELPEFKFGKYSWYFDANGNLQSTRPIEADEQYWKEIDKLNKDGEVVRTSIEFDYVNCMSFLENRGFARFWRTEDNWQFIHITPPAVRVVQPLEIRDSVTEFTKSLKKKEVLEMLYRGGSQYLGPDKLSNLDYQKPEFEEPHRDTQLFYFKDNCWKITADGVEIQDYTQINHFIWSEQLKSFPAKKLGETMLKVSRGADGKFDYEVTKMGKTSDLLQFLINTSNFTWRKEKSRAVAGESDKAKFDIDTEECQENKEHLISKLCAIGYMLMSCKDRNVSRAVVAMDGKQSEVGSSNGRSGKSILGEMFKHLLPTIAINGKVSEMEKDQFVWTELVEKTKIVFIDDVRTNFSLEFLFANITGDWTVNYKGGGRITFPFALSPKIYITTNHSLNGMGDSFSDRQWLIAFSDYYNNDHKPLDDFGVLFFDEWDYHQWNLLYNLMAECVQLYLKYGVVQAPGERLESRKQRQFMGETFIMWAEEYFSNPAHKNNRIIRKVMYDSFKLELTHAEIKYNSPTLFKKKILTYCGWKGYTFNPLKYDRLTGLPHLVDKDGNAIIDDKTGGLEYFTIGDENMYSSPGSTYQANEQDLFDEHEEDNNDYEL